MMTATVWSIPTSRPSMPPAWENRSPAGMQTRNKPKNSSHGDRYLSHRSRYTQVPVPATSNVKDRSSILSASYKVFSSFKSHFSGRIINALLHYHLAGVYFHSRVVHSTQKLQNCKVPSPKLQIAKTKKAFWGWGV